MSAVRLRVERNPVTGYWTAQLTTDRGQARVGSFATWAEALNEGCVAGRLQAAGISWGMPAPEAAPELEAWDTVVGTGEGQALPPLPDDAYPLGAIDLEELPVDAVGRSLPGSITLAADALTFSAGRRPVDQDVAAYLESIRRRGDDGQQRMRA